MMIITTEKEETLQWTSARNQYLTTFVGTFVGVLL